MSVTTDTPTVAEAIARAVAATGVQMAFGHPGGEVVTLIDTLRRAGVPFTLTHHENTAAFMAAGYGELTGRPGICIATLGPGATNMVTGSASALLERAPMLAFTGALARSAPKGNTHQALDLNAMYAPVAKRSIAVTPEDAEASIQLAIAVTTRPRFGPVHLSVPADVAAGPVASDGRAPEGADTIAAALADGSAIDRAREVLSKASRPAIVVGLGAIHGEASDEVRALARTLGAPVATLPKAKGVFPEDDPLFAGVLEMAGDDLLVEFLGASDALILVGVDVVEFDKRWRLTAPVIHVDELPNLDGFYPAEVELVGQIRASLRALMPSSARATFDPAALATFRARLADHIRPDGAVLRPGQVVDRVRAVLPRDAIATSDVGAHKMLVGQAWQAYEPRTFFMANGLSSMGYSIPVGAVATLVHPGRSVVSFVGDGGLGMYLGELETLRRMGIDLLIVVFADRSLELIRRAQLRRKVEVDGTSFDNPDFAAIGRAFGVTAIEATTPTELDEALHRAVPMQGIRLIAAHIDGDDYRF